MRRPRRKVMKQATAICMKLSKGVTKYNVSVAIHTWELDFKYVQRKVEYVRRHAFLHKTKKLATHCRFLHDIPRDARSQAWCSAVAEASFPCHGAYEKDQQKRKKIRRFLTTSRTMKYFMQASSNINGRRNGANIWMIT